MHEFCYLFTFVGFLGSFINIHVVAYTGSCMVKITRNRLISIEYIRHYINHQYISRVARQNTNRMNLHWLEKTELEFIEILFTLTRKEHVLRQIVAQILLCIP